MKREQKYGVTLTVVGILSLPFLIGIPLLITGIVLLAAGDRIHAERWIRVLFWIVVAGFALSLALLFLVPDKGHSAEAGIARAVFCAAPAFLAIMVSVAMAALTVFRFKSLRLQYRIMGLGVAVLGVLGLCIALVLDFPEPTLGIAGLLAAGWACMAWRKKRRARRAAVPEKPLPAATLLVTPSLVESVAAPPAKPRPPRNKKPVCGIWAWILSVVAVPLALLVGWVLSRSMDTSDFKGMGAGIAIMGFMLLIVIIAVVVSLVLVIISWVRRERYPALGVALLVAYLLALAALVVWDK